MIEMSNLFIKMIETLAILIVVASFVGGSDLLSRFTKSDGHNMGHRLLVGLMGGLFGVYGNLAGVDFNGAVVSIRDIGVMLSGFVAGPVGGITAGVIAGCHRLFLGGITAQACVVATCLIGLICGFLFQRFRHLRKGLFRTFIIAASMEIMHLCIVLIMVHPFETAWEIVSRIALPFIMINAFGFMLLVFIINYIDNTRKIALERSRLQSELEVATVIQKSMLPPISDHFPGREEIILAASMDTAKEVGGDFYDLFFIDDDRFAFVIADVSGKGIPAALFMVNSKQTIQNCLRDIKNFSQAVTMANESLCENNDAEMFVTAWIGVLDLKSGKVDYICAGHNPPVLISNGVQRYIKGRNGLVMGGMEGFCYLQDSFTMQPGDKLLLYTDGITEAENSRHELYGEERLLQCLQDSGSVGAQDVLDMVRASTDAYVDGFDQFDDMTMLCLEYRGKK